MTQNLCKTLPAAQVRRKFVEFFESKNHCIVPPSSVLCGSGHGTYFTNAGMNQFRSIFEAEKLPETHSLANIKRIVNSQRCIRMNDLQDVGKDGYHHTMFEMLGSWIFGQPNSKEEAIRNAWNLLTNHYKIDQNRLSITYFGGDTALGLSPDDETKELWLQLGIPKGRISPSGSDSNFWTMGNVDGPCGPCTEIHYSTLDTGKSGSWPELLELWNIVFISHYRSYDGRLRNLPNSHVDTGMGLERLTAVINGAGSNYETDIFRPIFKGIEQCFKLPAYSDSYDPACTVDFAYRVIADHLRGAVVAIADGVLPGNRNLGHKVRTLLTRLFCQLVAQDERYLSSLPETIGSLVDIAVHQSPLSLSLESLEHRLPYIKNAFETEADRFCSDWINAKIALKKVKGNLDADAFKDILDGKLSPEVLSSLATYFHVDIDIGSLNKENLKQPNKEKSKLVHAELEEFVDSLQTKGVPPTCDLSQYEFTDLEMTGKYHFPDCKSQVLAVKKCSDGSCWLVFDKTNLHASNLGGQVEDEGEVHCGQRRFHIRHVFQKGSFFNSYIIHEVDSCCESDFEIGTHVDVCVDGEKRKGAMRAHTACHLTMAALRREAKEMGLDENLTIQAGSHVENDRFTIDVQTQIPVTKKKLVAKLQSLLDDWLQENHSVNTTTMALGDAIHKKEVVTVPNEDYPPVVRMVSIEGISHELCCGTHVSKLKDIESAVITNVAGGKQGVKRLTIVTGERAKMARKFGLDIQERMKSIEQKLNSDVCDLNECLHQIALLRKAIDDPSLPRVVRDQLSTEMEVISQKQMLKTKEFVKQSFGKGQPETVTTAEIRWRSVRTETSRALIWKVMKTLILEQDRAVLFTDSTSNPGTIWVLLAIPTQLVGDVANKFKLRFDENPQINHWSIVDGKLTPDECSSLIQHILQTFRKEK